MATVTFDTLKFVETLKAAGIPEAQAKALAEAQREAFAETLNTTLATKSDIFGLKQDISDVRSGLKQDISDVRSELKQDISDVRSELKVVKWMLGILLGGVIALILKAFFPV